MSADARRKLLKALVAGGGMVVAGKSLPEHWVRPMVKQVFLPAHAQTSPDNEQDDDGCNVTPGLYAGFAETRIGEAGESVLDLFVKPAHAQEECARVVTGICLRVNEDNSIDIFICTQGPVGGVTLNGSGELAGRELDGSVEVAGTVDDLLVSGRFNCNADPERIRVTIEGPCPELGVPGLTEIEVEITAVLDGDCCDL